MLVTDDIHHTKRMEGALSGCGNLACARRPAAPSGHGGHVPQVALQGLGRRRKALERLRSTAAGVASTSDQRRSLAQKPWPQKMCTAWEKRNLTLDNPLRLQRKAPLIKCKLKAEDGWESMAISIINVLLQLLN